MKSETTRNVTDKNVDSFAENHVGTDVDKCAYISSDNSVVIAVFYFIITTISYSLILSRLPYSI